MNIKILIQMLVLFCCANASAQQKWENVDRFFQPLPDGFHVYRTTEKLDGSPFIAYYAEAKLKDKKLDFTVDTSSGRRLTPKQFYEKDGQPLLVMNCTFFSFETNKSVNVVVKDGKMVAYNNETIVGRGKDTFTYTHPFISAIGIDKKRNADVAWLYADSSQKYPYASQTSLTAIKDSVKGFDLDYAIGKTSVVAGRNHGKSHLESSLKKWKMQTAFGGGPVLLQNGEIKVTNNEERKFPGKAINDKHPRTCIGYTKDGRIIMMAIEGRFQNIAEGATLIQEAQLLKDLGCVEALNLDGGGSSCMLINGIQTIKPSSKGEQRSVPAVFIIK
jgi:hypothetical protein